MCHLYFYLLFYIYSETSLKGDREQCITQENDGKKIYENLKSPYISILTCYCLKSNCHLALSLPQFPKIL